MVADKQEADLEKEEPTLEDVAPSAAPRRRKQKGHRQKMLKDLPVEVVEYRLPPEGQSCPKCGEPLHEMKTDVKEELKYIPAHLVLKRHIRVVYACRNCEQRGTSTPIIAATMPAPVIPKSVASPSAVASIINAKYVEGLPLYRQEQQWSRLGVNLSRQTMANWVVRCSNDWFEPLYERLKEHLVEREILCADETTVQVLREDGRDAKSKSFMWLYRTGRDGPPIVLFDYKTGRAGTHAKKFLARFEGYLQVDGYSGYDVLPEDVKLVGCWAHARRKFDEALKVLPPAQRLLPSASLEGLEFCNRLFAIERELAEASPEERYKARLEQSCLVLDEFAAWLKEQSQKVLPKCLLGKAITYCLNQWPKLERFLLDGNLEIHNNRSERSIRPFVIGRKGWLFANTPKGARASAVIYSIAETAKENGLVPFEYFKYLLERLPNLGDDDLEGLLPWSPTLPDLCHLKTT